MSDNLYLFANNNGGQAEGNGSYRLYDMKIEGDSEGVESGVNYVDYLIGDGANYFDTGIIARSDYKYELIFSDNTVNAWERYFCGENFYIERRTNNDYINIRYFDKLYERVINYPPTNDKLKIYIDANKIYFNDELVYEMEVKDIIKTDSTNLKLFNNFSSNYTDMKCYSFKVLDAQNTLLIHLRPCLDPSGVPCMYDEVSKKYFYNKGTGTFKYKKTLRDFQPVLDSNNVPCLLDKINNKFYYNKSGEVFKTKEKPKYKKLKYLKGDGASLIDLGITTGSLTGYDLEIKVDEGTKHNHVIFGTCGKNDISNSIMQFGYIYRQENFRNYASCESSSRSGNIVKMMNFKENTNTKNSNVFLFGYSTYIGDSSIYYVKLFDTSDTLTLDLIPVLDQNNIPCMYDKVSDQFFYNQGTGTFGYEIEELDAPEIDYVEYLESTGTQYIDTGIPVYDNTSYEIKAANKERGYVFGVSGNYNVGRTELNMSASGCIPVMFSGGYKTCTLKNSTFGYPHTIKMTPTQLFIDGEEIQEPNWGDTVPSSDYKMRLFGYLSWQKSYITITKSMVYYFKTYKGEELIQDLRPCLDIEGIPCMYDTVSKQYYYNQGTGQFSYGDIIEYTPIEYIESNGTQYIDTGVVPNENTDIDMTCRAVSNGGYILNNLQLDTTYKYGETDTTTQPNLTASAGATLTMGTINLSKLDEEEVAQAVLNGWTLE